MEPLYYLVIANIISGLFSPKREHKYKNIYSIITSVVSTIIVSIAYVVIDIVFSTASWLKYAALGLGLATPVLVIICKIIVFFYFKKDGNKVPSHFYYGKIAKVIKPFYDFELDKYLLKNEYRSAKYFCFSAYAALFAYGLYYVAKNNASPNIMFPATAISILVLLYELGVFFNGINKIEDEEEKYDAIDECETDLEYQKKRFSANDDYSYLFRKNIRLEKHHIIHSTKQRYLDNSDSKISIYNFQIHDFEPYTPKFNIKPLTAFLEANHITPNKLYVEGFGLLDEGNNVMLKTPSYKEFEPYLISLIKKKIAQTNKVVVIIENVDTQTRLVKQLNDAFVEYYGLKNIPIIETIEDYNEKLLKSLEIFKQSTHQQIMEKLSNEEHQEIYGEEEEEINIPPIADIIIATNESICDKQYQQSIRRIVDNLGLIVYYDFSECLNEDTLLAKISHTILDKNDDISTLYITDGFFDFTQSIRNFFSTRNIYDIRVPRKKPDTSYDMIWKYENSQEYQQRAIENPSVDFGMHIVLCQDALRITHNDAIIIADESDTYSEQLSEYATKEVSSRINCYVGWKEAVGGDNVFCTVTDRYNNIPHTYLSVCGIGQKTEYINIVSKPYLLREYLSYHLKHFETVPDTLTTFSSGIIQSRRAIAIEAVLKGHIVGLTENQAIEYAKQLNMPFSLDIDKIIDQIIFIANNNADLDVEEKYTIDKELYYISEEVYDKIIELTEYTKTITFKTQNDEIKRYARKYKYLVNDEKVVLNGKKYTITNVENVNSIIEASDTKHREPFYASRIVRTCDVDVLETTHIGSIHQNHRIAQTEFTKLTCNVVVNNNGKISFKDAYTFNENSRMNNYIFIPFVDKKPQTYNNVNAFKIKFTCPKFINTENKDALAHAFALLLNETMPTFFPKHSDRIIVGCSGWNSASSNNDHTLNDVVAKINDSQCELKDDEFCIYIMEDSAVETGIINVFFQDEEFRYIIKIIEDFLYFIETVDRTVADRLFGYNYKYRNLLHELRKLILYVIDEPIEVDHVEQVNSIRRTRFTFNSKKLIETFNMTCDYCGKKIVHNTAIDPYHFYGHSGFIACPECYKMAVCSEKFDIHSSAFTKLNQDVYDWIEKRYKEPIFGPSVIALEDPEYITSLTKFADDFVVSDDEDSNYAVGITQQGQTRPVYETNNNLEEMTSVADGLYEPSECEDRERIGYYTEEEYSYLNDELFTSQPEPEEEADIEEFIDEISEKINASNGDEETQDTNADASTDEDTSTEAEAESDTDTDTNADTEEKPKVKESRKQRKRRIKEEKARSALAEYGNAGPTNRILIINGLVQNEYQTVFAHELTHQWQHENLDIFSTIAEQPPMQPIDEFGKNIDIINFRIEGHAVWVEFKAAKKFGNSKHIRKTKKSFKNNVNEYSFGYKWFCHMMKVFHDDPYSDIPRSLLFKIKRNWYQFIKDPYALMNLYYGSGE